MRGFQKLPLFLRLDIFCPRMPALLVGQLPTGCHAGCSVNKQWPESLVGLGLVEYVLNEELHLQPDQTSCTTPGGTSDDEQASTELGV